MGCASGKQEIKIIEDNDKERLDKNSFDRASSIMKDKREEQIKEKEINERERNVMIASDAVKNTITEKAEAKLSVGNNASFVNVETKLTPVIKQRVDDDDNDNDNDDEEMIKNKSIVRNGHVIYQGQDKDLILAFLQKLLKDASISSEELRIVMTHTIITSKLRGGNFKTRSQVKFSIIKNKIDINFNKAPYSGVKNEVEEYFIKNPKLMVYYGFDWDCSLLEYEQNYLEFKLKKANEDGSFEDYVINSESKNKLIMFFNHSDTLAVKKMLEMGNLLNKAEFDFIPIHGEKVKGKKEASIKKQILINADVNLDIFFMPHSKNAINEVKLEKYIKFKSNDNMDNIISTAVFIDSKGFVRFIDSINNLSFNDLLLITGEGGENIEEVYWESFISQILKNIEERGCESDNSRGFIKMKKAEIYSSEGVLKTFFEPIHVKFEGPEDFLSDLNKMKGNYNLTNHLSLNQFRTLPKLSEKNLIFNNEMNSIKEKYELGDLSYTLIFQVNKRYDLFTFDQKYKKKSMDIQMHLPYEQLSQFNDILNDLNIFRTYPLLDKINYYSVTPVVNDLIPDKISLIDSETKKEVEVELSPENPKFLLIFGYSQIEEERKELVKRLERINLSLKGESIKESIDFLPIFKGESLDQAQDLLTGKIFNGQQIFLIKPNSNFPLYFEDLTYENSSSQLFCLILDIDNHIRYIGSTDYVDLDKTLNNMKMGYTQVDNNDFIQFTDITIKENFKPEFEEFRRKLLKVLTNNGEKSLNYQPSIEFSFQKHCLLNSNDGCTDVFYQNLKIDIIFKQTEDLEGSDTLKSDQGISTYLDKFENTYGGFVNISSLTTKPLHSKCNLPEICPMCEKSLDKEGILEYVYNTDTESITCIKCGENSKPSNSLFQLDSPLNIIFCRFKKENFDILNEVIDDFHSDDFQNHLAEGINCALCERELNASSSFWVSLIHINDGGKAVIICDGKCFEEIGRGKEIPFEKVVNYLEKEWNIMDKLKMSRDSLILRRITGTNI